MDCGYDSEEEWAPNPYQAEFDAHYNEMLTQLSKARVFDEQGMLTPSESTPASASQGDNDQKPPRRFRVYTMRNFEDASANDLDTADGSMQAVNVCNFGQNEVHNDIKCRNVAGSALGSVRAEERAIYEEPEGTFDWQSRGGSWNQDKHIARSQVPKGIKLYQLRRSGDSSLTDGNATDDTAYVDSSGRSTLELSATTDNEWELYQGDSRNPSCPAFIRYSGFQSREEERFDSMDKCSQHEACAASEPLGQFQSCEDKQISCSRTWKQQGAYDNLTKPNAFLTTQAWQHCAVEARESRQASAVRARNEPAYCKIRLREMLVQELLRESGGVEDLIKGWNVADVRVVMLGIMHNFAKQGNIYQTEKCADVIFRLDAMPVLERTFNILLVACMKHGDLSTASRWWSHFTSLGLKPSSISYNTMINVCARARDIVQAERWMYQMIDDGIQPCLVTFTTLIVACGQSGSAVKAETWFQTMHAHGLRGDVALYNSMISTYAKVGNAEKAERWFRNLQAQGLIPSQITFNSLINACVKSNNLQRADLWRREMVVSGYSCDEYTYGSLMQGCANLYDMDLAEHYLLRMISEQLKPNLVCLRSLIKAYGFTNNYDRLAKALRYCMHEGQVSIKLIRHALELSGAYINSRALQTLFSTPPL